MPSRPGEFHPEPLTDPDLTLSRHPARATARRLPPSVENWSSSCCQLARSQWRRPTFFAPRALHPLRHYYRAVRPSPAHRYFRPRGWSRLRLFPSHRRPGSHVPYQSQIELRAAYMPDAAWAVSVHPPSSSRKMGQPPVLTSSNYDPLRTRGDPFCCGARAKMKFRPCGGMLERLHRAYLPTDGILGSGGA
jgi:hypothetical protein